MTVYTDGSKSDDYVSASAGFPFEILKVNIAVSTSIFTAQAVALKLPVQYIQRHPSQRTVIYSDSLSWLQALENKNFNHSVIREIIQISFKSLPPHLVAFYDHAGDTEDIFST